MKTYIKELKKYLGALNAKTRDEIIKKIQSSVDEKNCTYDNMVTKFGTSKELAYSYLEDVPIKKEFVKTYF